MKKNLFKVNYLQLERLFGGELLGVFYFKFVSFASPLELTIHRTIWTSLLLVITTSYYLKWPEFIKIIKRPKNLLTLFITGLLISINWFTWLYAVSVDNLLDGSFGYYMFPILSVFFGVIFLKESINRNKVISILLVMLSIFYLLYHLKSIPWIGLIVAITFSLYGLIRKKISVSSDIGLLIETKIL